ncbi:uncharacterized protein LOC132299014 [Cornus florida]|uniref:uncharacterized protein LOC132299014 n=1 Tax=Cornus florida TaxID=4283 RepID=UPI00289D58B2|nr:uncharacterized protein LOC132299014 [Cornus florida]
MAADRSQTLEPQISEHHDDESDLEELDKLEADVNRMAQRILEYRTTLPDQLKNTLASVLASQRPVLVTHPEDGSEPGPSGYPNPDAGGLIQLGKGVSKAEEDQETAKKTQLLKRKITGNVSAMPIVLKRVKECMTRIDNLDSCKGTIHPVFRRKRTS